jgi:CDP-diacylglycerol--glycerol-3-phosphate 3-phosphatidyltransferase
MENKSASIVRHVPNLITIARLLAAPALVWLALRGHETGFTWLLIAALISDIADGLVARILRLSSTLGAMLDSTADVITMIVAAYGASVFHPEMFREHWLACSLLLGGWAIECAASLVRYGRLSSFHTYASKATGYLLGFFIAGLFLFGYLPWLFYPAITLSVLSSVEELLLLWWLPVWRANVRGLWWLRHESGLDVP